MFQSGKVVAERWACCLEEHENTSGYHYHARVRLSGLKRSDPVKRRLHEMFDIQVNFSELHETTTQPTSMCAKTTLVSMRVKTILTYKSLGLLLQRNV